jgi:hypothetical protein
MLATENGLFNHDRIGVTKDVGFCQISPYWHPDIVNNPRFLTDPQWQMDTCYELFTGGTVFYGYKRYLKGGKYADTIRAKFNF